MISFASQDSIFNYPSSVADFDVDSMFDLLNLQSNDPADFTTSSGFVDTWKDRSVAANNGSASSTGRPLFNGGNLVFDGLNDFVSLTNETAVTTFSMYIVFKRRVVNSVSMALVGSTSPGNNFFRLDGSTSSVARQVTVNSTDRPPTGNFTSVWRLGGEEQWSVLSFRRSGSTFIVKDNDRTVINVSIGEIS